jgi:hypothetical protein
MKSDGRKHWLEQAFSFDRNIYNKPDLVIVENETHRLIDLFSKCGVNAVACQGKAGIKDCLERYKGLKILLIFDGGSVSNSLFKIYEDLSSGLVQCFAADSFESLLLNLDMFASK